MLKKIKSPLSLSLLWFLTPLYFLFLSLQSLFFLLCHHIHKAFFVLQKKSDYIDCSAFICFMADAAVRFDQCKENNDFHFKHCITFKSLCSAYLYFPPTEHPGLFSHRQHVFNFSFVFCLLDTCWWRQVTTASWRHGIWGGSTIPSRFRNAVWPMKSTGHWMHRGFWWPRTMAPWCKKACLCFFVTTLHLTHLHCISGICL